MSRLRAGAVALAASCLLAAGCGGGTSAPKVPCDDAAFRNQSEELYVTIATAQNARAAGASAGAVDDLAKAVGLLRAYLDAHPPCEGDLKALEADEREALGELDAALAALRGGEEAGEGLDAAVKTLGQVEVALR